HEMLSAYTYFRTKGVTMIGPNCPGVLSPGKANVGIIPAEIFSEGTVGLVSRSGTLTYQIGHELTQFGLCNSTIVGIGGDPVVGYGGGEEGSGRGARHPRRHDTDRGRTARRRAHSLLIRT